VIRTGGHSMGHQAIVVPAARTDHSRSSATSGMRPWSANPRWITAFDDFPLDSVGAKAELFARAVEENWLIALSHEPVTPSGA
jgi:glyoxylase-like metal-dependent hydrolase (beta-lactamase superfamily II)